VNHFVCRSIFAYARLLFASLLFLIHSLSNAATAIDWREETQQAEKNPPLFIHTAEDEFRRGQTSKNKILQLSALRKIAVGYDLLAQLDQHIDYIEQGIALSRDLNAADDTCNFLVFKSEILDSNGAIRKEVDAVNQEAEAIANKNNLNWCLGKIDANKGSLSLLQGDSVHALIWLNEAYILFEMEGDSFQMAQVLENISGTYLHDEGVPSAMQKYSEYMQRASALRDANKYPVTTAVSLLTSAKLDLNKKDYAKAREELQKAMLAARAAHYDRFAAMVDWRTGDLEMATNSYAQALLHYDRALSQFHSFGRDAYEAVKVTLAKATAFAHLHQKTESLAMLSSAYDQQVKINNPALRILYLKDAADVYTELGEFRNANSELQNLREAEQKLAEQNKAALTTEMQVRFDVKLKETENELLRAQSKQASSVRLIEILALALALLMLGAMALLLRRRNVAAHKEAQHQHALADAEATANRAKSAFLVRMSHELRSPLNAIIGFTRLSMRDSSHSILAQENLSIVLKSSQHLHNMINEILDLSKIEAGRVMLTEQNVNLVELMQEIANMFALSVEEKGLRLNIEIDEGVPQHVRIDGVRLRQILINLLGNALKFTDDGSIAVHVQTIDTVVSDIKCDREQDDFPLAVKNSCQLFFAVTDTGIGIAEDELTTLGHAFVQGKGGRQQMEGTGLGLAISRKFVELMGGKLRLTSQPGLGTQAEFSLTVQVLEAESTIVDPTESARHVSGIAPGQRRHKILVVDDGAEQRFLFTQLLTPLGFEVREATNGAEAIAVWHDWSPDLICIDMCMPVIDGCEATRRIRAMPGGEKPVIIALTASNLEPELIMEFGCDDYLAKPFSESAFFELVRMHLGIEFLYETTSITGSVSRLDLASLSNLSEALRQQLQQASTGLDIDSIDNVIEAIAQQDAALADALHAMAAEYQYDKILSSLNENNAAPS
jgi:signal transduction histidine kinase/CheY-like chemotaxis protein